MANHTTSTLSANLHVYYSKQLLDTLGRTKIIEDFAERSVNIPTGAGQQVKWLRYDEFNITDPTTVQLVEGQVPSEATVTTRNLTATTVQYGNFAKVTDRLDYTAIDPVMENINKRMAEQSGQLVDIICRNELDNNLPNQFANSKANLAATGSGDVLTAKELLKAVINLQKNSVPAHERGYYVGIIHPACLGDLMNDTNVGSWVDLNKYVDSGKKNTEKGEAGMVYGCKVFVSDLISSTTSGTLGSATVYSNLVLGKGAFGTAQLGAKNVQFKQKSFGSGGVADPLDQVATVGYKLLGFVPKYFGGSSNGTADRGYRIRAGVTLAP